MFGDRVVIFLIAVAGAILAQVAVVYVAYHRGADYATEKLEKEHLLQLTAAREERRRLELELSDAVNQVSLAYERGKQDAEQKFETVVADLRAGRVRMHRRWQACEDVRVSVAPPPAAEPDAAARDREESAARIVRAAAQCDAQVRGLQALVKSLTTAK